ncbi:MAG: alpha/beta fold hydrolase [Verrucomicrobiae bacterium]
MTAFKTVCEKILVPMFGSVLLVLALAYLGICFYVFLRQRSMLYHPETLPEEQMLALAGAQGLARWTDSSGRPLGWVTDGRSPARPVLILHGNAGNALDRNALVAMLREAGAGAKIYLVDYPGYGAAPGSPDQKSLISAAVAALDALPEPVIVVGESLGSGIAAQAATQRPEKILGLVLITPFDSLSAAAAHHYPWLPVRLLLLDRFDSVKALKKFTRPVAIVIGERDGTTPPEGGRRLFDSLSGPKKLWVSPGADHNEAAFALPAADWRALWEFVSSGQQ